MMTMGFPGFLRGPIVVLDLEPLVAGTRLIRGMSTGSGTLAFPTRGIDSRCTWRSGLTAAAHRHGRKVGSPDLMSGSLGATHARTAMTWRSEPVMRNGEYRGMRRRRLTASELTRTAPR